MAFSFRLWFQSPDFLSQLGNSNVWNPKARRAGIIESHARFSLKVGRSSNENTNSPESLFSPAFFPWKHSPHDSPNIIVGPSWMGGSLVLVGKSSSFQFCLGTGD